MTILPPRFKTKTKSRVSAWLILVVMFAVLLKASVPAGFMPSLQTNDTFKMVICTIDGAKTVEVDGDYNPLHTSDSQEEHTKQPPCEFSVNTAFIDTPVLSSSLPAAVHSDTDAIVSEYRIRAPGFFFGNASSQSPPAYFYV